jgi:phosphopantothenoylcysteine synthetase/decarboxylase
VSAGHEPRPVLYVITCATPAAHDVGTLVGLAQGRGWTVCVVATPSARRFIDTPALEQQTGYPVRHDYKQPGTPDVLPPADAMIVGGASFNTINKWALGISDTLALGLITEAIGLRLPVVALPFLNAAQAAHPAFGRSVAELREAGVAMLPGADGRPHTGGEGVPWVRALEAVDDLARERGRPHPEPRPAGS